MIIWHPTVHEALGRSRLCIWRLKFFPTYQSSKITPKLEKIFDDLGVRSYALYELLGDFDILCRIWLPNDVGADRLDQRIAADLHDLDYEDSEFFEVSRIARHWAWLKPDSLDDDGHEEQADPFPAFVTSQALAERMAAVAATSDYDIEVEHSAFIDEMVGENLCRRIEWAPDSVKFFIVVKRQPGQLTAKRRNLVADRLRETCTVAAARSGAKLSLYLGSPSSLIIGEVPFSGFHAALEYLIESINTSSFSDLLSARTYTSVNARDGFLAFREQMPSTPVERRAPDLDLDSLLAEGENEAIEFKSTAVGDLRRYFQTEDSAVEPNEKLVGAWMKTIAAMLNSRVHGVIVFGVGELEPLMKKLHPGAREKADAYLATAATVEQSDLTYVLLGFRPDLEPTRSESWDGYARWIQQRWSNDINPDPTPYLRITRLSYGDLRFLAVRISPPMRGWFYVAEEGRSTFYWRKHGETEPSEGVDADLRKDEILRNQGGAN